MKVNLLAWTTAALAGLVVQVATAAPFSLQPVVSLDAAKQAADAAQRYARGKGAPVAVAIVDAGGRLVYLERADGVPPGMADAAVGKARTAADYGLPTQRFEELIRQNRAGFLDLPGIVPLAGGLPIIVDDKLIGAIGVAGGQSPDDAASAQSSVDVIRTLGTARPPDVH